MTRAAFWAVAAVSMMATPAMAQGYVGLEYSSGEVDAILGSADIDGWRGEGAVGFGGEGSWGGQIGGSFGNVESDSSDADTLTLDGHLFWTSGDWRLGGVVALTQVDDSGSTDEWAYGVESMLSIGANSNLYASLTAGSVDSGGGSEGDLWNLDGGGNFYASPNFRFGAMVGIGNIDFGSADADTMSAGLNGEFQPWSAPVSITFGWTYFEIDDADLKSNSFHVGARWNFGGGTVQERDGALPFTTGTGYFSRLYGVY